MAAGPRTYVMPAFLAVTPDVAPQIHALLASGRAEAEASGGLDPGDPVRVWLADLDRMVPRSGGVVLPERGDGGGGDEWVTTATAAEMLGIGERAMRNIGVERVWGGRRGWLWRRGDVEELRSERDAA
jgi:hypothetical protein